MNISYQLFDTNSITDFVIKIKSDSDLVTFTSIKKHLRLKIPTHTARIFNLR